jgi:hypothetical protein
LISTSRIASARSRASWALRAAEPTVSVWPMTATSGAGYSLMLSRMSGNWRRDCSVRISVPVMK